MKEIMSSDQIGSLYEVVVVVDKVDDVGSASDVDSRVKFPMKSWKLRDHFQQLTIN